MGYFLNIKSLNIFSLNSLGKLPCVVCTYSKAKKSWHLWADHEVSSTMPNFHLRAVFFEMESNIEYDLESE